MYRTFKGSAPGPLLEKLGKENQDFAWFEQYDDWNILIVADGAGSLKNSRVGAELSVNTFVYALVNRFNNVDSSEMLASSMVSALENTVEVLKEQDEYRELGSTFAAAVFNGDLWATVVVGDAKTIVLLDDGLQYSGASRTPLSGYGAAEDLPFDLDLDGSTVVDGNNTFLFVVNEGHGEFANITELLTSDDPNVKVVYGEGAPLLFAVGSDGIDTFTLQNDLPYPKFWYSLLNLSGEDGFELNDFLQYLRDNERLVDDTTMVFSVRN